MCLKHFLMGLVPVALLILQQRALWIHETIVRNRVLEEDFHASEILEDFLYLGPYPSALQFEHLQQRKITHVVSIVRGVTVPPRSVPDSFNASYLVLKVEDRPDENLLQYADEIHNFINEAKSNDTAVLIHCMAGVSRSATIVLSYLMKHHNLHLDEALNLVRDSRPIINPNHGFRAQLSEYEQMIRSKATIPSNRSHVMRKCRMNDCEYLSGNSLQEFVEDMWFYLKSIWNGKVLKTIKNLFKDSSTPLSQ